MQAKASLFEDCQNATKWLCMLWAIKKVSGKKKYFSKCGIFQQTKSVAVKCELYIVNFKKYFLKFEKAEFAGKLRNLV